MTGSAKYLKVVGESIFANSPVLSANQAVDWRMSDQYFSPTINQSFSVLVASLAKLAKLAKTAFRTFARIWRWRESPLGDSPTHPVGLITNSQSLAGLPIRNPHGRPA